MRSTRIPPAHMASVTATPDGAGFAAAAGEEQVIAVKQPTYLSAQLRESAPYLSDAGWRETAVLLTADADEIERLRARVTDLEAALLLWNGIRRGCARDMIFRPPIRGSHDTHSSGNYLLDVQFRVITDVEFKCDGQSEVRSARTLIKRSRRSFDLNCLRLSAGFTRRVFNKVEIKSALCVLA